MRISRRGRRNDGSRRIRRRPHGRATTADRRRRETERPSNRSRVCYQESRFGQSDDHAMSAQDAEPPAQEAAGGHRLLRPRVHRDGRQQKK